MIDLSPLKEAGVSIHVIAAGAGAGIQSALWAVPGASSFLSGCSFPYAADETAEVIGFQPERLCDQAMAIDLASAAYMRAYRFGGKRPVGVGLTAAVPSSRERRGDDRCHACVITGDRILVDSYKFERGRFTREMAGGYCDLLALTLLRSALGLCPDSGTDASQIALARFLGRPFFTRTGRRLAAMPDGPRALMPGAFNPPHPGHLGMADEVEAHHHLPVAFYVTAKAPHKAELTVQELLQRAKLLRGHDAFFTRGEALYIEKARRFPGRPIVMGTDALARMLDPSWGPDVRAMLFEFAALGTHFLVSPRPVNGRMLALDDALDSGNVDCELRGMFTELAPGPDVSSTALRMAEIGS